MSKALFRLPPHRDLRIGLFGGSFNPAHKGHLALSEMALKKLQLDHIWWMVSPQNPLKDPNETDDFQTRLQRARALTAHPRIHICDFEASLNTRNTSQTLAKLDHILRRGQFVWLMGADSFASLHKWHRWKAIPGYMPMAVFDRPGYGHLARHSPAAHLLQPYRIKEQDAVLLADHAPPCWCFVNMPLRTESSTAIRGVID